jgi:hypothetical protein
MSGGDPIDSSGDRPRERRRSVDSLTAQLSQPMMIQLFGYWRAKCRDGRLPGRQDIDPLDVPDLLPHIAMYDVVHEADRLRFRIRLLGTANVQLMGSDCTGRYLDEQMRPDDAARITATYRSVVEERRPHYWRSFLSTPGREHMNYERLLLPLAADGTTVDMVLALFLPLEAPAARG